MLNDDCLMLVFKATKPNIPNPAASAPHQVHDQNQELLRLRRVRRGWKRLIDSQPHLWNSVSFILGDRASMESASLFLHYSRTAPIYLYGHGASSPLDGHTRRLAHRLEKQLQVACDRIVSFHISKPDPQMIRFLPANAQNLRELVIETTGNFPAAFRGNMPMLRSIITPVKNEHQHLMTRNITNLTLYPPYTLNELLITLHNTPMLRRLELRRIFEFSQDDLPQVFLPHLEELFLYNCWHEIVDFIYFPEHTRITVSIPEHIKRAVSWQDTVTVSPFFIPSSFLRSSTLAITTNEVPGPTEVRITGCNTTNMNLCHVYIDFNKDSGEEHRHATCKYAMGIVRNLTSVSSVRFDAQVKFHAKCISWLERFGRLKTLILTGPSMYPLLLDLVSAELDAVPLLQRLVLDQTFVPIYRKFKDWAAAREQAGYKLDDYLIPIEIDK